MVEKDSENFYSKYLRISLPFLVLIFLSFSVFALTTTDKNYSSGVYNGGFEFAPTYIADTNVSGRWIDGTQAGSTTDTNYGYKFLTTSCTGKSRFSDNNYKSGSYSLYLNSIDCNGVSKNATITIGESSVNGGSINIFNQKFVINIKPNTRYKLSADVVLYNVSTSNSLGFYFGVPTYNSNLSRVVSGLTNFSGYFVGDLNSNVSFYFTTGATEIYATPYFSFREAVGEAYVDNFKLEEVGSVNLSGQSQGRPSIVVTGKSDFNAIDQADTNNSSQRGFGTLGTARGRGQCFTPTQNKFNGIIFQRGTNNGTFIGDVVISLRNSNGTVPIGNPLASVTIPNATWNAINTSTDYKVELPYTLDANGTNKYCIDFNSTTFDNTNYPNIGVDSSTNGSYSGGTEIKYNGSEWLVEITDLYFKTLFEKQSSSFDLNVCSSGDSVCESKTYDIDFLENNENYLINPADAPLFYEGDNNVYFMMHSDSDYNNKTPSMMAKLTYTFDKPTTTILVEGLGSEKTITLTCTPSVLGACDKTYYNLSGTGYQEYTTPLTLTQPNNYTFSYYSTDTGENTETPTTITITVNPLGERIQNILPSMLQLGFLLLLASIIIGLLSSILIKNEYVSLLSVIVGACAIIMIFISILL